MLQAAACSLQHIGDGVSGGHHCHHTSAKLTKRLEYWPINVQNCWVEVFPIEYRGDGQPGRSYFAEVQQAEKRRHEAVHPPSLHIPPMSFEKRVGGPMWWKKRPPQMGGKIDQGFDFSISYMCSKDVSAGLDGNKTTNDNDTPDEASPTSTRPKRTPAWKAWSLSPSRRAKSDRACWTATLSSWKQWK